MEQFDYKKYLKTNPLINESYPRPQLTQEEVNDLYDTYPEVDYPNYEGKEEIASDPYGENATFKITVYEDYDDYGAIGDRVRGVYEVFSDSTGNDIWWEWGDHHYKDNIEEDRFEDVEHVFSGEESDLRHDGTSWKEFDDKRDNLMTQAEIGIDELLTSLHDQAYELGGDTNGPGIWYDIKDLLKEKI